MPSKSSASRTSTAPRPASAGARPSDDAAVRGAPMAAARAMSVLSQVSAHTEGCTLAQLSAALESPKSSLVALLRGLCDARYLMRHDQRYTLGPASFGLAASIVAQRRFPDIALPLMRDLARRSGETVFISALAPDESAAVYIARAESENPIRFMASVGERRPLYSSSGGRCLLAFQPKAWQEAYLRRVEIVAHTPKTVTSKARLREILAEARRTGVAMSNDDTHDGVTGLASPIRDHSGQIIAALVFGCPTHRAAPQRDRLAGLIREAAQELSRMLGYDAARAPASGAESPVAPFKLEATASARKVRMLGRTRTPA